MHEKAHIYNVEKRLENLSYNYLKYATINYNPLINILLENSADSLTSSRTPIEKIKRFNENLVC